MNKRQFSTFMFTLLFACSNTFAAISCNGRVFNPVTDMNWNNGLPVVAGGQNLGKSGPNNPALHSMPAVCTCGIKIGVGVTYWEPSYVAEIARSAGCLSTMGGTAAFGNTMANMNASKAKGHGNDKQRMQVHWYKYPVAAMMDVLKNLGGCISLPDFQLAYMSEVDPDWNAGPNSILSQAEALLFSNPIAIMACLPEVGTALFNMSLDVLFWCSGSQGTVYPMTGDSTSHTTNQKGNIQVLAKYVARTFKTGGIFASIGPWAQCSSVYSPVWLKSQFRIDPIYPIHVNRTIVFGKPEAAFSVPSINTPTQTESAYMIWQAKQCCASPL
jgi:conjugal transfer pilus assembly protein TraU